MARKKILFMAEAVTLAHVGRPLSLAQGLDEEEYEVHFACADGYDFCFKQAPFRRWRIDSISSLQFLQALAHGKPVYTESTLHAYVEDDLRLLNTVQPDLVIGDFRLSLSVSARLQRIPYMTVSNAYWSPWVRQHYTVPSLPLTGVLPVWLADPLFRLIRPLAFASHAVPLNRVRRRHGLPSLGSDLRRIYTDADRTLYADIPQLFPPHGMPSTHDYLGPIIWAPPLDLPDWWQRPELSSGRPIIYVTLGSSGQGTLLPRVLRALAPLPVTVLAATAGTIRVDAVPPNAYVAPFLPGDAAARRASLVICNGGSPTSQQACPSSASPATSTNSSTCTASWVPAPACCCAPTASRKPLCAMPPRACSTMAGPSWRRVSWPRPCATMFQGNACCRIYTSCWVRCHKADSLEGRRRFFLQRV